MLAGFAGLLPDIDYPLAWMFPDYFFHGMFHLIYVGLFLALLTIIFYYLKLPRKYYLVTGILAFGFLFHLSLDCVAGGYEFFYPFSVLNYCKPIVSTTFWPAADAIILLSWLTYEFYYHKIKSFI